MSIDRPARWTAAKVVKAAGGKRALARELGYPVNVFVVSIWVRNDSIPEEYHREIARFVGCTMKQLRSPDVIERPLHKGVARAYAGAFHAVGLRPPKGAALHKVHRDQVKRWLAGYDEAPLWAFADIIAYASGRGRAQDTLSLDEAMKMTGMDERGIAALTEVSRARCLRWRASGRIPPAQARKIWQHIGGRYEKDDGRSGGGDDGDDAGDGVGAVGDVGPA